jgi:hypothetical protein
MPTAIPKTIQRFRVFASMVTAVTPSGAGATTTTMPVASPLSCPGCPLTVIFVAGVTLYSLEEGGECTLTVIEARWTALTLSLVSDTGAGALFFDFDFPCVTIGNETAAAIKTTAIIERIFTALFQPRAQHGARKICRAMPDKWLLGSPRRSLGEGGLLVIRCGTAAATTPINN